MAKAIVKAAAGKQQRAAFAIEEAIADTRKRIEGAAKADLSKQAQAAFTDPALLDVYRIARTINKGGKLTRKQAAAEIAERLAAEQAAKADKQKEDTARVSKMIEDTAKESVDRSLRGLMVARDMLLSIEQGEDAYGLTPERNAEIIGTFLMKHASKLEQALYQLGIYEGEGKVKGRNHVEGIFNPDLFRIE
jgi:hypothetical protein